MRSTATLTALFLVTSMMLAGPVLADDDTVTVCQDGSCDRGTIQAGINNADPGDRVVVSDGTYTEQITIDKSIALVGNATIEAPEALEGDEDGRSNLVTVVGGDTEAKIAGFTITGPVDGLDSGIQIKDGAFALVEDNAILAIRDDPISGAQHGVGVTVGPMWTDAGTPGEAVVTDNVIQDFQKSAVTVGLDGSQATITGNDIACSGDDATDTIAQDAIRVWQAASADIVSNTVTDCFQTIDDAARGVGVHLSNGVHDTTIVDNKFEGAQTAILGFNLDAALMNVKIAENTIDAGADGDGGVYLAGTAYGLTIEDNIVTGQDSLGVFVGPDTSYVDAPDSEDVRVTDNLFADNDAPALWVRQSAPNVDAHFNEFDGNELGVLNTDDDAIDAAHNWWGSPAGPTLLEATSDVTGDAIEGPVAFAPFCLDSDCTANEPVHESPAPHAAVPPVAVPPAGP